MHITFVIAAPPAKKGRKCLAAGASLIYSLVFSMNSLLKVFVEKGLFRETNFFAASMTSLLKVLAETRYFKETSSIPLTKDSHLSYICNKEFHSFSY